MTDKQQKNGIIYLVGSGPGHPGLITKLGYDLLNTSDAVVYDDLIPIELVVALPESIKRYYVGKRAGHHSKPQNETNDLLCDLAGKGLTVVRLKGGDPMVFGRVAEEAAYLKEKGIPHQIIPGITSASAAAADAGFSLTDRRNASWVMLATGREAKSASAPVPWEDVGKLDGGTIVVYMGVKDMERIVKSLLEGGMSPDKPIAVIQNASTGIHQTVR
ncbi:MAG: uroporphyrinogen-III C-methyltransferase, partial [Calditrichaeota bacterium]|nr:uroporphyrinogen-III C-methyltransferase [Calditrichota bacterium]